MTNKKDKYRIVIEKNTFYFYNSEFQENYESYLNSLTETLLVVKNEIETQGLKKEIFISLLEDKENGLRVLLALTGFANESLRRIVTLIRVTDNKELSTLMMKDKWSENVKGEEIAEWGDSKLSNLISGNKYFRIGLVNLFFEGSTIPFLANTLPLFELKKLSISKLRFETPALIDTLVRYKEKGSYSGKSKNNPELIIANVLNNFDIKYEQGDLTELFKKEKIAKRTMDFIIPNKKDPKLIIESSYLVTTSSGQGDKSKTESSIKRLITKYYPKAIFIGFIDGIGWYVRKGDLKRMVSAYDEVFTFHKDEIFRFKNLLKDLFK